MVLSGFFGYLIGGAVIGILARFLKPGADSMGWILTIVLGVAGAFAGSWISTTLGIASGWLNWVIAIGAAVLLLFIYEALRKKKA